MRHLIQAIPADQAYPFELAPTGLLDRVEGEASTLSEAQIDAIISALAPA
jgi:hypothetical protein